MKTSLRKLVATAGGLAIAAMLPVSMMASAAGDPTVKFSVDKEYAKAGETIKVSVAVDNVPQDAGWNLLEYTIGFNADQLEPVKQGKYDYGVGSAFDTITGMASAGLSSNPVPVAMIDADGQFENGEVLSIAFKVKEGVADGTKLELNVGMKNYAQAVVEDSVAKDPKPLVAAFETKLEVTAGEKTVPTQSSGDKTDPTGDKTDPTGDKTDPTGDKTDTTDSTESTDTTSSTDDVIVTDPTTDNNGGGAATGESTTLFVVALVLMAGSAVALVGMKKKVFSK